MLPILRSHEQYQTFVEERLRLHYSNGSLLFIAKDWTLVTKFWITDLSGTFHLLQDAYSCRGPQSIDPANLLRFYLLMLEVGEPSITEWVNHLRRCPLYAILSGFEYGHTPGVGTFYDFFQRLWSHGSPNLSPRRRLSRKKPERGKKGEKAPTTTPNRIGKLLSQLQRRTTIQSQPFDVVLRLFQQQFLSVSSSLGLLGDVHALSIAGDGMPVQTAAQILVAEPVEHNHLLIHRLLLSKQYLPFNFLLQHNCPIVPQNTMMPLNIHAIRGRPRFFRNRPR